MSNEAKTDLILSKVDDLIKIISEVKNDIKTVFEKINTEHDINIEQNMEIRALKEKCFEVQKAISIHLKTEEEEEKENQKKEIENKVNETVNKVKIGIIWGVLGFVGLSGLGIIITTIIKSAFGD
jgi:hypothetical protein